MTIFAGQKWFKLDLFDPDSSHYGSDAEMNMLGQYLLFLLRPCHMIACLTLV